MARAARSKRETKTPPAVTEGCGGELHQAAREEDPVLTTNQGVPVADNQNTLRCGPRGPSLLEDFVLREKITHFDHERIPERIVHARGSGAHGYFQPYRSMAEITHADFLQDPEKRTPVFARFSTVAGGAGSADLPRDVRGFAVKFYTEAGNFDLVGNNIPVFFIQDAMKFPDLIHATKMEADRGFPQAATAHDTFWDFASLMPESMHMLLWIMSDRAIPRSLRMMEGFGVHTFKLVNAKGKMHFVKFHWRPRIGAASVLWDEAVKICGVDPDYHRRDLWNAIERGDYPEWELCFQVFDEKTAETLPFDHLDPTKLIPEELVPLEPVGKMVLDRNPDNFFAETEQIAFHPGHVVPGIDFSDDPLLQGRLFSYLDTQLIRLGGPNFHQLPINKPRCPMHNFQRDGHMQMDTPRGRTNYEPSSLEAGVPREDPQRGFVSHAQADVGGKVRLRPDSFSDHYSQARQFFRSMTKMEQQHIVSAFAFELGRVEAKPIRCRMLGHLMLVDKALGKAVEKALGMTGMADAITPARMPVDLPPSPALSLMEKAEPNLAGRQIGVLLGEGADMGFLEHLRRAIEKEGASLAVIAPLAGGVKTTAGAVVVPDHTLAAAPSVLFDAIIIAAGRTGAQRLMANPDAYAFLTDAWRHLKLIGHTKAMAPLMQVVGVKAGPGAGVLDMEKPRSIPAFIKQARKGKVWTRHKVAGA